MTKKFLEANEKYRNTDLKFNIEARRNDKTHNVYSHFALIKAKMDYNIYQSSQEILLDTRKC